MLNCNFGRGGQPFIPANHDSSPNFNANVRNSKSGISLTVVLLFSDLIFSLAKLVHQNLMFQLALKRKMFWYNEIHFRVHFNNILIIHKLYRRLICFVIRDVSLDKDFFFVIFIFTGVCL